MLSTFFSVGALLFHVLCSQSPTIQPPPTQPVAKSVRFVYLVSKDRPVREDYRAAIEKAARDIQKWYAGQLGGRTFRLNDPVVEVARSDKEADWFYGHPNGANKDDWGYNNGLDEVHRLLGARHNDPLFIWVIYSDGPGNKGRGGTGVTVLPEDDLLGLIGKHPTQKDVNRWIAGLGHELGHALGLAHPSDTTKDADAIMWTGIYGKYPNRTYLTQEDKQILRLSPFILSPKKGEADNSTIEPTSKYVYDGGAFSKYELDGTAVWVESKKDGEAEFRFTEVGRSASGIVLEDRSRGLSLRLPLGSGSSSLSTDQGKTWSPFYKVQKAK